MNEKKDKKIYVKGHALKIYSDDYVRENGKKVDEIIIGYGGVGGQYVYLNTSDKSGYELPVSGLVYEEYPNGQLWYYTTCNDAGLPVYRHASAEYFENGSLRDAAFYNEKEQYSVEVHYDINGTLLSESFGTDGYEENTFINSNGKNNVESIRDDKNNISYRIEFNDDGNILEVLTRGVRYKINENNYLTGFCKENKVGTLKYYLKLDVANVLEKTDRTVIFFSFEHSQKILEPVKMLWNEKETLICKHECLDRCLIHGVYWNDNGELCKEYLGFHEFLIELIYDETEKIIDCKLWVRNNKNKDYAGHLEINKTNKVISLIDDNGEEIFSVNHNNKETDICYNVNENHIKTTLSTVRLNEKTISTVNAPEKAREFADFLFDKTKKYLET